MKGPFGPDELVACYRRGVFPMAEARDSRRLFLVDPIERGVFPLDRFHVPSRLARTVRADRFKITVDTAFREVMAACAEPAPGRGETWINQDILDLYTALFTRGQAHSVEARLGDDLVGGLYGVSLAGAFFGESMFSRVADASKVALVHLAARLISGGYRLLDAQFHTPHLAQFGAEMITRKEFKRRLIAALALHGDFSAAPACMTGAQALQSIAQTS